MPKGRPKKEQLLELSDSKKKCLKDAIVAIQNITSCYGDLCHPQIDDIIKLDTIGWSLRHEFEEYIFEEYIKDE